MQTWRSFKERTGDGRFQTAFHAIEAAIQQLAANHHLAILSIVLFGSLARRRSTYDDIDMLIVTRPWSDSMSEVTRRFAVQIFGALFLEYGELFSFIVYTQDQLTKLHGALPLLTEIQREGVLLYGQDPFIEAADSGLYEDRPPSVGNG